MEAYGLTETSPGACVTPPHRGRGLQRLRGPALPSTVITIRDDDAASCRWARRRICIRGPSDEGLLEPDRRAAKVMTPDGDFRTGDIGFMSQEGFVKIVDARRT